MQPFRLHGGIDAWIWIRKCWLNCKHEVRASLCQQEQTLDTILAEAVRHGLHSVLQQSDGNHVQVVQDAVVVAYDVASSGLFSCISRRVPAVTLALLQGLPRQCCLRTRRQRLCASQHSATVATYLICFIKGKDLYHSKLGWMLLAKGQLSRLPQQLRQLPSGLRPVPSGERQIWPSYATVTAVASSP